MLLDNRHLYNEKTPIAYQASIVNEAWQSITKQCLFSIKSRAMKKNDCEDTS